jgi:DNA-binding transcriptional LysR family regulator
MFNGMDLDATALRTMRAVAEAGSISGAARILGTSQPAVSQQVHRLERRLGTALLQRAGRSIRLTEAGHVLARHGRAVTAAVDAASEEIAALTGLQAGRVRLVAFPSSSATLVPGALSLLGSRYPGIRVELTEAEPPEALADLQAGRADVAVVFSYDQDDTDDELGQLAVHPLLDDPMWLVLPAGHPSAGATHLGDLREQTWIAGCHRCRGHLLDLCRAAGFVPQIAYATDDYVAVLGLVAAGLGVAVLPELVLTTVSRPDVHLTPLQPSSMRRIHAVTTRDLQRVPAVTAAIDALTQIPASSASPSHTPAKIT